MTRTLTLGYSPCPNDTFIFHALVHGLVPTARASPCANALRTWRPSTDWPSTASST